MTKHAIRSKLQSQRGSFSAAALLSTFSALLLASTLMGMPNVLSATQSVGVKASAEATEVVGSSDLPNAANDAGTGGGSGEESKEASSEPQTSLTDQTGENAAVTEGQESVAENNAVENAPSDVPAAVEVTEPSKEKRTLETTLSSVDGNQYVVRVSYDEGAGIPEGTQLAVTELNQLPDDWNDEEKQKNEYKDRPTATENLLGKEEIAARVEYAKRALGFEDDEYLVWNKFLKLSLVANGTEVVPASDIQVQVELKGLRASEADALEVVALDGESSVRVDAKNETESAEQGSRISFGTNRLGELCLAEVAEKKFSWNMHGDEVSVYGARSVQASPSEVPLDVEYLDGLRLIEVFGVAVDPTRDFGTTLWIESHAAEGAAAGFDGVLGYSLAGESPQRLFDANGMNGLVPFAAGDAIALVWDSGFRSASIQSGDVTIVGEMPEGATAEARNVTDEYADAAQLVGEGSGEEPTTVAAYDLAMGVGEVAWSPDEEHPMRVKVASEAITPSDGDKEYEVLQLGEGGATPVASRADDGSVVFDAAAAGTYVVVQYITITREIAASDGKTYNVTVTYDSRSGIPANADLVVSEVSEGDDAYAGYVDTAAAELGATSNDVTYAKALDITLVDPTTGEHFQPTSDVAVSIELMDAAQSDEGQLSVVHFHGDAAGGGEVMDSAVNGDTVEFATSGFSVYVVVATTLEQKLTASDGNEYLVTVTYDNASGIPSDAELYVSEIKEGETGYEEYVAQSAAALGEKPENLAFARPFDITLKNPETGEEYQPNEAVQVSIQLLKDDLNSYASVDVVHIPDGAGEEAQVMDTTVHEESVEFATDGFSVYVLCGFTVDFHWGEYTYSIAGESGITLSELFEKLGVIEIALSDVESVAFSNPELVAVEPLENDWRLTSLAPFTTEEALVLTLKNGQSVEIAVTDAQPDGDGWNEYTIDANAIASGTDNKLYWKIVDGCLYIHCDADIKENKCLNGNNFQWWTNTTPWADKNEVMSAVVTGDMTRLFCAIFAKLPNLASVSINCPKALSIDSGAFQDTGSNVSTPTAIDFSNCTDLTTINTQAFYNCYGKTRFSVSFEGCVNLTTIATNEFNDKTHQYLQSANFSGTGITAFAPSGYQALEELHIPATITSLNLKNASKLKKLVFDGSRGELIEKINSGAITLPTSLNVNAVECEAPGPKIVINTKNAEKAYDGQALTAGFSYTVDTADGKLFDGHELVVTTTSQTVVGRIENEVTEAKVVYTDDNGNEVDVTDWYTLDWDNFTYGTLTVTPKTVTVTADNVEKIYGDPDPKAFTATVEGLVPGESEDLISYKFTRDEGEDVGSPHDITPTGEATQGNYAVTFKSGKLTINRARATVIVDNKKKSANAPDPEFTATVQGLKNGDTERVLTYTMAREDTPETPETPGSYKIVATGDETQGNYTVTYIPGTLTIYEGEVPPGKQISVHVVDATDEQMAEKSAVDGWIIRSMSVDSTSITLPGTGYVTPPSEDYQFAFVAAHSRTAGLQTLSHDEEITAIHYDADRDTVYGRHPDGTEVGFDEATELYYVYYGAKQLSVAVMSMDSDGNMTVIEAADAPTHTAPATNEYTIDTYCPQEESRYNYCAWAVGDAGAERDSQLYAVSGAVAKDKRPALGLRNTWRGIEYSIDNGATWQNCGFEPTLYMVYFEQQPTTVVLRERTIGTPRAMKDAFTYTIAVGEDTRTIKLKGGEEQSAVLYLKGIETPKITVTQAAAEYYTTKIGGQETLVWSEDRAESGETYVVEFTNTLDSVTVEAHVAFIENGAVLLQDDNRSREPSDYSFLTNFGAGSAQFNDVLQPQASAAGQSGVFNGDTEHYGFAGTILMGHPEVGDVVAPVHLDIVSVRYGSVGNSKDILLKDTKGNEYALGDNEIYYLYYPKPEIKYVKSGAEDVLEDIKGSPDGEKTQDDPTIEYEEAKLTFQQEERPVEQDQTFDVPAEGGLVVGENGWQMPEKLDDGVYAHNLVYEKIGIAADKETSDITWSEDGRLYLRISGTKLQWSTDNVDWKVCTTVPKLYAFYAESGYDLKITKAIDTTGIDDEAVQDGFKARPFEVTVCSDAITKDNYVVDGVDASTITPTADGNPGTIAFKIKDGNSITIRGLSIGDYSVVEGDNDNYTLTAKAGPKDTTEREDVGNTNPITLNLGGDTGLDLTNKPKPLCRIIDNSGEEHVFFTIQSAVTYAEAHMIQNASVEMLTDYLMPASDQPKVSVGYSITLTTAEGDDYTPTLNELQDGKALIRRSEDKIDAMFINESSLTLQNITLDGANVEANAAMIESSGASLTISDGATMKGANNTGDGGAIYAEAGEIEVSGILENNRAGDGGAIAYTGTGTITLSGDAKLEKNAATGNGGAIVATGGAVKLVGSAALWRNTADNGGAIAYTGTGTIALSGEARLQFNAARVNGGAIYASSGAVAVSGGSMKGNAATGNGGAIYNEAGSVTVGGAIGGTDEGGPNRAKNGAAIYVGSGTAVLSSGSITGNVASEKGGAVYVASGTVTPFGSAITANMAGEDGKTGLGGAIYVDTGTVDMSTGVIGGGDEDNANKAENGAAIFVNTGKANLSGGSVTGNIANNGGAVGVGGTDARLYLSGNVQITGNKMSGNASNIYLDQDTEAIINVNGLGSGAAVGVYPAVQARNLPGARFAMYTNNSNVGKIVNDRVSELKTQSDTTAKKLFWGYSLKVTVCKVDNYGPSFQNNDGSGATTLKADGGFYPEFSDAPVSELGSEVLNKNSIDTGDAVFAGAFLDGEKLFAQYITRLWWNEETGGWYVTRRDGTTKAMKKGPNNFHRIYIYYADPAYVKIENNAQMTLDEQGMPGSLNVTDMKFEGASVVNTDTQAGYGMVYARNGAIQDGLLPVSAEDLKLDEGQSVVLLIPGGRSLSYTLDGRFGAVNEAGNFIPARETSVRVGRTGAVETQLDLNAGAFPQVTGTTASDISTYTIVFGDDRYICKVEYADKADGAKDVARYTRISDAIADIERAASGTSEHKLRQQKTATIEMLTDYLLPNADEVSIPQGYDITLTTAQTGAGVLYPYIGVGDGNRAIISRNSDKTDSMISAWYTSAGDTTTLRLENLIFDGKSVRGSSNGGAVRTRYTEVRVDHVDFKNVYAQNGGALLVMYNLDEETTKNVRETIQGTTLEVSNSSFTNCQSITKETKNRLGGGAIVTNAARMNLDNCHFTDCTAVDQAGAVFHRVDGNYDSWGTITGCTFTGCTADAAGGLELDSKTIEVSNCQFFHCIARGARNGGGFNVYALNTANPGNGCSVKVTGCLFEDCHVTGASGDGGGFRCNAQNNTVADCTFRNCSAPTGGAISFNSTNGSVTAAIQGCTIEQSSATKTGGGINVKAKTVTIEDYTYTDEDDQPQTKHTRIIGCNAVENGGGIYCDKDAKGATLTITNAEISDNRVTKSDGSGGGIYAKCETVSINGTTVTRNRVVNNGGGIHFDSNNAKKLILIGSSVTGNIISGATGKGAGIYCKNNLELQNAYVQNNQIQNVDASLENAAGVYIPDGGTLTIGTVGQTVLDNSCITDNTAFGGQPSNLRLPEKEGGTENGLCVTVNCGLGPVEGVGGRFGVVNAKVVDTQFGTSIISKPTGFRGEAAADEPLVFWADDNALHGIVDPQDENGYKLIWAGPPVCKLTDPDGNLLYFAKGEVGGLDPAIFDVLDDGHAATDEYSTSRTSAFRLLRMVNMPTMYTKEGDEYKGPDYCVKMLVEYTSECCLDTGNIGNRSITLTTASKQEDYPYTGVGSTARILRSDKMKDDEADKPFLSARVNKLTLTNITLDGQNVKGTDTSLVKIEGGSEVVLGSNARLLNGAPNGNGGGVNVVDGSLTVQSSAEIQNCNAQNGGGIYMGGNGSVNYSGRLALCTATQNGGGVCLGEKAEGESSDAGFAMSGGRIERCSATYGGGVYVGNDENVPFAMSGGTIANNSATQKGGGLAVGGIDSRVKLSGKITVNNNSSDSSVADGKRCNIELDADSTDVIHVEGSVNNASIGVYVPGENNEGTLYWKHGRVDTPFGNFVKGSVDTASLYCFVNDREQKLHGMTIGTDNLVYWGEPVARVCLWDDTKSDSEQDWSYHRVLISNDNETGINFGAFNMANSDRMSGAGSKVVIETLLESNDSYAVAKGYTFDRNRGITLRTTQNTTWNPAGSGHFTTMITRGYNGLSMLTVTGGSFTVEKIILDGGSTQSLKYTATDNGGIINVTSGDLTIAGGAVLRNSETSGYGGAVSFGGIGTLSISGNVVIRGNQAVKGGGVYMALANNKGLHGITDASFYDNVATDSGGGLYVGTQRQLNMENVTMAANLATGTVYDSSNNDKHNGNGGAVYIGKGAEVQMERCAIGLKTHPENASRSGGNESLRSGGGIYVFSNGSVGKLNMNNTKVSYNTSGCGGGIGALSNSELEINNSEISYNTASQYMEFNNSDSGIRLSPVPEGGKEDERRIYHRGAGGGIGIQDMGAKLIVKGGKITGNKSDGGNANNYLGGSGGGFYSQISAPERCVLDGVEVSGNVAAYGGGGSANNITLKNGTQITGNRVEMKNDNRVNNADIKRGGGLYMFGGTLVLDGETRRIRIDGNYARLTDYDQAEQPSDLRLSTSTSGNDNKSTSVKLNSYFYGKIRVCNPGNVNTQFGTSDAWNMKDISNSSLWESANFVAEDGSKLFGRIKRAESGSGYILYWWQEFVCKITDNAGNLLYKWNGSPAVFMRLFDKDAPQSTDTAFGLLNYYDSLTAELNAQHRLYTSSDVKPENEYTGEVFCVKMLTDYELRSPVLVGRGDNDKSDTADKRTIILTTAEDYHHRREGDPYWYRGTGSIATVKPSASMANGSDSFMFRDQKDVQFTLTDITLDGGAVFRSKAWNDDGTPNLDMARTFKSTKDGVLVQVSGTADLIVDSGATLQNAYTTHQYGGGAICVGNTSGKRSVTIKEGSRIYRCCAARTLAESLGGDEGGYGGAISFYRGNYDKNSLTIEGGTIEQCWAYEKGGAIFIPNKDRVDFVIKGGAIKNCRAKHGGGIYLDDRGPGGDYTPEVAATLKIEGKLDYSGNYGTDYADYASRMNGKDGTAYRNGKARQDIFVASLTQSKNPTSATADRITVTGPINAASGSIWIWVQPDKNQGHYKDAEQFAVFANADGSEPDFLVIEEDKVVGMKLTSAEQAGKTEKQIKEAQEEKLKATLEVFHNALDDNTTRADETKPYPYDTYLTGCEGALANCIYWGPITNGFNVVFRKIDGYGKPLNGATFTLYKATDDGRDYSDKDDSNDPIPFRISGKDATAISGQGTEAEADAGKDADHTVAIKYSETEAEPVLVNPDPRVYGEGLVVFEKIPAGVYFIVENTDAEGTVTIDSEKYKPVEEKYRLIVDKRGWYTVQVAPRNANGQPVWDELRTDASGNMTWPYAVNAPKVAFAETTANSGMYSDVGTGTNTIEIFTAMNVSSLSRKTILKKVDGTDFSPLGDTNTNTTEPTAKQARFTVYYADKQTVVRVRNGTDASGKDSYETLENMLSDVSGVFWIGKLPYGTYYLHETHVPTAPKEYDKLSTDDNWFILTVNEDGVGAEREDGSFLNALSPLPSKP